MSPPEVGATASPVSTPRHESLLTVVSDLFQGRERWYLAGACTITLIAAVFETLGVASILPFMALVLDPTAIQRYHFVSTLTSSFGVTSERGTLLLIGGATIGTVALGNAASALNLFVQQRFSAHTQTRISSTLLRGYLRQPYAFHVERDAPSLLKVLTQDVGAVMGSVIIPFMLGLSRALTAAGVLGILFIHDAKASMIIAAVFAALYLPMYRAVRTRQRRLGVEYNTAVLERQRLAQETLGGVKELQTLGRERYAADRFERWANIAARAHASNTATSQIPRNVLETIAFGGILLVTMTLVASGTRGAKELVPLLALYAFAGYRLMPALQQVFASVLEIRFRLPSLYDLHGDFALGLDADRVWRENANEPAERLPFEEGIVFRRVTLNYPGALSPAVHDVNLTIRPHESVGLIGATGAGKTSVAEMVLGIHVPTRGSILIDGVPIAGAAARAWRRDIGFVPQRVFLSNASVAENIAFGLDPAEIDRAAVIHAARVAQATEFIEGLPQGFDTPVGERGVKLSGGQAQRIGIARALYNNPRVLVFDEATSALDLRTEHAVMEAIRADDEHRTLIHVAHRLRSIERCDRVVMMQDGTVVADGTYQSLLMTSTVFRHFVGRPEVTQSLQPVPSVSAATG
ncbi:MAG: ABC transporter ATP-binding protein [Gemmatimonadaceae bacterium]